jgi:hypothetical protein
MQPAARRLAQGERPPPQGATTSTSTAGGGRVRRHATATPARVACSRSTRRSPTPPRARSTRRRPGCGGPCARGRRARRNVRANASRPGPDGRASAPTSPSTARSHAKRHSLAGTRAVAAGFVRSSGERVSGQPTAQRTPARRVSGRARQASRQVRYPEALARPRSTCVVQLSLKPHNDGGARFLSPSSERVPVRSARCTRRWSPIDMSRG